VTSERGSIVLKGRLERAHLLPPGAIGIDAGMTLTKRAASEGDAILLDAWPTGPASPAHRPGALVGVTGARAPLIEVAGARLFSEIDAGARGATAMLAAAGRDAEKPFVLALMGTGTAFAAVSDGKARHLGGTALGGGSFAGIARIIVPGRTYVQLIAGAARGDRTRADLMVSDAYPDGIGRISSRMTAAHLSRADGNAGDDDLLAALLNLHGESIGQIAASRAVVAQIGRVVLAGGFAHGNPALVESIGGMSSMFGLQVEAVEAPGFAGAIGAALLAAGR
jgi:type II pantothenate kinase